MNAGQLHRLARLLRDIAQVATANEGEGPVAASTVAIVEDVTGHPQSPITEIAQRTGLAQSLVSRTVDRLRALGVLTVGHDPADGRRTLVSVDPQTRHREFTERAERPISDAIRQVVAGVSGEQQRRIEAALAVLGDELLDRSPGPPSATPTGRRRAQKSNREPIHPQGFASHPAIRVAVAPPALNDYPDPDE
ncbi:MAG TPA: MarR family winged helix-turn-helix transcriptional regulator [Streptosporangiaceae bacterium]|nr:MarR family winged helix-turn-helix transcriptional regulator [Streptosporangiaceae bacterium]